MEIIALFLFMLTIYFSADIYYEKICQSKKHPIVSDRPTFDEDNERRFRILIFSPVVFLLFYSGFRNMPDLDFYLQLTWVFGLILASFGIVYFAVNAFFILIVRKIMSESCNFRIDSKYNYNVNMFLTGISILTYIFLRMIA